MSFHQIHLYYWKKYYLIDKIINLKKFYYPKDNKTLNLESLFLLVNSLRENPWPMPKTLNNIVEKLYNINIVNSYDLSQQQSYGSKFV